MKWLMVIKQERVWEFLPLSSGRGSARSVTRPTQDTAQHFQQLSFLAFRTEENPRRCNLHRYIPSTLAWPHGLANGVSARHGVAKKRIAIATNTITVNERKITKTDRQLPTRGRKQCSIWNTKDTWLGEDGWRNYTWHGTANIPQGNGAAALNFILSIWGAFRSFSAHVFHM